MLKKIWKYWIQKTDNVCGISMLDEKWDSHKTMLNNKKVLLTYPLYQHCTTHLHPRSRECIWPSTCANAPHGSGMMTSPTYKHSYQRNYVTNRHKLNFVGHAVKSIIKIDGSFCIRTETIWLVIICFKIILIYPSLWLCMNLVDWT